MSTSRQFRLAARPVGEAKASDFELAEVTPISLDSRCAGG
jgi:hypothetical protein